VTLVRGCMRLCWRLFRIDDVGRLVADALHLRGLSARGGPWRYWCTKKTGGNPFFAIQFFTALADEGLSSRFGPVTRAWQWDIDRIRARSYTDNVVDLMAGKLKRLFRHYARKP